MKWVDKLVQFMYRRSFPLVNKEDLTTTSELSIRELERANHTSTHKASDISEPVISFVNKVKSDRKRFHVLRKSNLYLLTLYCRKEIICYELFDKQTGGRWCIALKEHTKTTVVSDKTKDLIEIIIESKPEFLTDDEVHYVVNELTKVYDGYQKIMSERKSVIASRNIRDTDLRISKERERLKTIYCEESV